MRAREIYFGEELVVSALERVVDLPESVEGHDEHGHDALDEVGDGVVLDARVLVRVLVLARWYLLLFIAQENYVVRCAWRTRRKGYDQPKVILFFLIG
jgi:hypothetical protein